MSNKKKINKKRKKERMLRGFALVLCTVFLSSGVAFGSNKLKAQLAGENEVLEQLQVQIEEQKELKTVLEERKAYVNSDEYVKELAREKLRLADPGDIIFKKAK